MSDTSAPESSVIWQLLQPTVRWTVFQPASEYGSGFSCCTRYTGLVHSFALCPHSLHLKHIAPFFSSKYFESITFFSLAPPAEQELFISVLLCCVVAAFWVVPAWLCCSTPFTSPPFSSCPWLSCPTPSRRKTSPPGPLLPWGRPYCGLWPRSLLRVVGLARSSPWPSVQLETAHCWNLSSTSLWLPQLCGATSVLVPYP